LAPQATAKTPPAAPRQSPTARAAVIGSHFGG